MNRGETDREEKEEEEELENEEDEEVEAADGLLGGPSAFFRCITRSRIEPAPSDVTPPPSPTRSSRSCRLLPAD